MGGLCMSYRWFDGPSYQLRSSSTHRKITHDKTGVRCQGESGAAARRTPRHQISMTQHHRICSFFAELWLSQHTVAETIEPLFWYDATEFVITRFAQLQLWIFTTSFSYLCPLSSPPIFVPFLLLLLSSSPFFSSSYLRPLSSPLKLKKEELLGNSKAIRTGRFVTQIMK